MSATEMTQVFGNISFIVIFSRDYWEQIALKQVAPHSTTKIRIVRNHVSNSWALVANQPVCGADLA